MDVSESSQPDGGLVLTCDSCDREVDPVAGGGLDDRGFALCAYHMGKELGYYEGRADQARETLWTVVQGVSHGFRGPIGTRLVGDLSPAEVRADVERVLEGKD